MDIIGIVDTVTVDRSHIKYSFNLWDDAIQ